MSMDTASGEVHGEVCGEAATPPEPLEEIRARSLSRLALAKRLFEVEFELCGGRKPADPTWEDLDDDQRAQFLGEARRCEHVHREELERLREQLVTSRDNNARWAAYGERVKAWRRGLVWERNEARAELERAGRLAEAADNVIRAVCDALGCGYDTDPVLEAERLRAELAREWELRQQAHAILLRHGYDGNTDTFSRASGPSLPAEATPPGVPTPTPEPGPEDTAELVPWEFTKLIEVPGGIAAVPADTSPERCGPHCRAPRLCLQPEHGRSSPIEPQPGDTVRVSPSEQYDAVVDENGWYFGQEVVEDRNWQVEVVSRKEQQA
jgi:hypothetical protein